jgi:hypothetical protein
MTAPDIFRLNAYRVLRVPASASAFDIHKAGMRRAAAPGFPGMSDIDIPELGDVPRQDADIYAAVIRLANPVQRLRDRLFWFCQLPTPSGTQHPFSAIDPTDHDTVLRDVINVSAMQGGLDVSGLAEWVKALRAWHALICDDDYWFLTCLYEDQGGFEAPATTQQIEALRSDAVRLAAEPLLIAAHAALAADDRDTVRRVCAALARLRQTGQWASDALEELACASMASVGPPGA